MTTARASLKLPRLFAFVSPILLAVITAACGGNERAGAAGPGGPGGAGGAMPPMPVEMIALAAKPVEQTSEFVASLKSRRSTTIQPEVEGFITRIAVRSGTNVGRGDVLFEIDSAPEQAALGSLQSMRPMRESEVDFARQQVERNKTLLNAGAISQREVEQFESQLRSAEAQLKALDEQIRQQRSQLNYYRVTSPNAGTVGDIPVNVGDRVTRSTVLTTVEENDMLELYINVPVQQAPQLKVGLRVRLIDDRGQVLATNRVTFVSPSVDTATQSVLAKAQLVDGRGDFRSDQFVRARIVWSEAPGLTVPVTAVVRINAQYFAFVAEKNDQGMVARQKPVQLGEIVGNDYIVRSGLQPGEQLIVGGLQKIRDGAPVMPAPQGGTPPAGGPPAKQ
jgi:RND family efflux transporter MFP subunit